MPDHTIAENLQRLLDAKSAISNAITVKGGTVGAGDGLEDFATDIGTIPSGGGGGTSRKDVNFIDYDGTIVHSYTAAEFAELTEFPSNPEREGLTARGWMWSTFAKAKAYVAKYGKLDIGQKYRVTDGKTRIFIELDEYRREPVLGLGVDGSVDIDWGDGSEHTTLTGTNVSTYVSTQPHTYPCGGEYMITLTVTGTVNFLGKSSACGLLLKDGFNINASRCYMNTIKKLFIGDSVTTIQSNAFYSCNSLSSVTIPDSVTTIQSNAFYSCNSLSSVTIPDSVTTIQLNAFYSCYSLSSVTIPDSVTTIQSNAFYNCPSLSSVTIPDSVTTIQSDAFYSCPSLSSVTIPDSVTTIQSNAFYSCKSLSSVTIPDSVTTIQSNAFYSCPSLSSVTIPDSVTTIGQQAFYNCPSLSSVTIPDSVTTIQSNSFNGCYSLGSVKFEKTIPPTVQNANVFTGIPTDCAILVKSYAYLSVSNYPSPSTYTYAYYDTFDNGVQLPTTTLDGSASLIWYATIADIRAETNPITVGNGKEVYAKMTARTRINNFTSSVNEVSSGTTLTTSVDCNVGDLVIATIVIRGNTYTLSSEWTILGISEIVGTFNQRTLMAYKIAESSSESITVTQDSSARIYTNLVALAGASVGAFSGFTTQSTGETITMQRPSGLVMWGVSSSLWSTTSPYDVWGISNDNDIYAIELPNTTQPRCLTALDQGNDTTVSFTYAPSTTGDGALAAASLVITGITDFWHYVD